ncbi:uncharacterized protein [Onthophagus taurus]|uniref:uncharacterized protein n=1 Tax=Onthophagus taurus TaxID=166361 RepID=UPI0039BE90F6
MPPKKRTDANPDSDVEESKTTATMSTNEFAALLEAVQRSQLEFNRQLLEQFTPRTVSPAAPSPAPSGSFARCSARFDGSNQNNDAVEAFVDAVQIYKECTDVSDDHALRGLPLLLTGEAAIWWQGVKSSVTNWNDAIKQLRAMYGITKPAYKLFRDLFNNEQGDVKCDVFLCRARSIIAKMPYKIPEEMMLDMVYGLLNKKIRKHVSRECVNTFDELIQKARDGETLILEYRDDVSSTSSAQKPGSAVTEQKPNRNRPRCSYCKRFGHLKDECRDLANKNKESDKSHANPKPSDSVERNVLRCYGCCKEGVIRAKCPICKENANKNVNVASLGNLSFYQISANEDDDRRPLLLITVGNQKGVGFVDTGAQISVAGWKFYEVLKEANYKFTPKKISFTLADGKAKTEEVLETEVEVNIESRTVRQRFIVLPNAKANRTLLGADFLSLAGIVLDIPHGEWWFRDVPEVKYQFFLKLNKDNEKTTTTANIAIEAIDRTEAEAVPCGLRQDEATRLTEEERECLSQLLLEFDDIFGQGGEPTPFAEHRIETSDCAPTAVPPYRMSPQNKEILRHELEKMLSDHIIEECESPWAAPVVLVPKKDGSRRVWIDYRKLN